MTAESLGRAHLEENVEDFFRRQVRLLGGRAIKLVPVEKGMPDRLVLLPGGLMFLVELKQAKSKPSPAQVVWHMRAARMGHPVAVLHTKDEVRAWLRKVYGDES